MSHASGLRVAVLLGLGMAAGPSLARSQQPIATPPAVQAPNLPAPVISIASVVEEKQKLLRATVTLRGAPLEGARVRFGVARTFGVLDLGSDATLDDGTAGVPFPEGLPGGKTGTIEVVASVEGTKDRAAASARIVIGGAGVVAAEEVPFPHALWSSKPLWPLVTIIVLVLGAVWGTYIFVVRQLVKIRNEVTS
jgi:hypothetical protein